MRVDRRPLGLLLALGLIVAVWAVVVLLPGTGVGPGTAPATPVQEAGSPSAQSEAPAAERSGPQSELDQRFRQAVAMLHAGRHEYAVVALRRVLELAPGMVEAYVNMGFALLGLEHYDQALDYFNRALELRPTQANAYWGLAMVYDKRGEPELAIGAMRTFAHLADEGDPFLTKAQGALWEWETRRGRLSPPLPPAHAPAPAAGPGAAEQTPPESAPADAGGE